MAAAQEPGERDFYAEARLIMRNARSASLATAEAGAPHAALVTIAFTPALQPILLLSALAIHTRQLAVNPACALLLTGEANGPNPQTTPRLCLSGTGGKTADPEFRQVFLGAHPYAEGYAGFGDFAFWGVQVTGLYFIGGFGAARHLEVAKVSTGQ